MFTSLQLAQTGRARIDRSVVMVTKIVLNNEHREPTVIAANNCLKAMLDNLGVD